MGADAGDYDGDLRPDLVLTTFAPVSAATSSISFASPSAPSTAPPLVQANATTCG